MKRYYINNNLDKLDIYFHTKSNAADMKFASGTDPGPHISIMIENRCIPALNCLICTNFLSFKTTNSD